MWIKSSGTILREIFKLANHADKVGQRNAYEAKVKLILKKPAILVRQGTSSPYEESLNS